MVRPLFVLIPGPLVGLSVWSPVAGELRGRGHATIVATLTGDDDPCLPFWRRHVQAVAAALAPVPKETPLLLIGHSGAGASLPVIGQDLRRPVAGELFVDAHVPTGGENRLDLLAAEHPEIAAELRQTLEAGGRFPTWTDADLAPLLPDTEIRQRLLAELRPHPLAFFTEPIPVPAAWPDAPCGYLRLSAAYDGPADRARAAGWPVREIAGNHFQMLVDPAGVTVMLLALYEDLTATEAFTTTSG
jgi:hypothetical protein